MHHITCVLNDDESYQILYGLEVEKAIENIPPLSRRTRQSSLLAWPNLKALKERGGGYNHR